MRDGVRRRCGLASVLLAPIVALALLTLAYCERQPSGSEPVVSLSIGLPLLASETGPAEGVKNVIARLSEEGLVRTDWDGRLEAQLAVHWEVLADGSAIRFDLRQGVKFQDGTELTSDVVKTSLEHSRTDPVQVAAYPMLRDIQEVIPQGRYTLVIPLKERSPLVLSDLEVAILKRTDSGSFVGTGPFQLSSESAEVSVMEANPYYHRGRPHIDEVHILTYTGVRTAWATMLRGELDVLYEVPVDTREFVEAESSVRVFSFLRPYAYLLVFNMRDQLFHQREVRAALNVAVDRELIIERVFRGYGEVALGVWPLHWAYGGTDTVSRHDPTRADDLLTLSGLRMPEPGLTTFSDEMPSRLKFVCLVATSFARYEPIALMVQRQLFNIGVDMRIEPVSLEELNRRIGTADYDAVLLDLNGGPGLVRAYRYWHSSNDTLSNGYHAADAALDALRVASDEANIRAAAREFQRVMLEDPPALFLTWPEVARAISRRFEVPAELGEDPMRSISQWRLSDSSSD